MNLRRIPLPSAFLAGALAVGCVSVTGLGVAVAADGGSLVLGHTSTATKTTTLKDSRGTPLALIGKRTRPPLSVNSSKQVAHLNASLLGGKSATGLETYGSGAHFAGNINEDLPSLSKDNSAPSVIGQTAILPAGAYYVSGFAYLALPTIANDPNNVAYCFINPVGSFLSDDTPALAESDISGGRENVAPSTVVTLTKPTALAMYCESSDGQGAIEDGGVMAIRIAHFAAGTTGLSQSD